MDAYSEIRRLMEDLAMEGVDREYLEGVELDLVKKVAKAQKQRSAYELFPVLGVDKTADRLNVSRSTVYKLYHRQRNKISILAKP